MRNLEWQEGAPAVIRPGMVLNLVGNRVRIVGHDFDAYCYPIWMAECVSWAWLCKPHELEWLEDMAKRRVRK